MRIDVIRAKQLTYKLINYKFNYNAMVITNELKLKISIKYYN